MSGAVPSGREDLLGVVVTHGLLGRELRRTAESILGGQERLTVVSNAEVSHDELTRRVLAVVEPELARGAPVVVFVDLLPGSCGRVCRPLARRHPGILLVSGVNLPLLIEFLHHRGRVELAELRARLQRKGQEGITVEGWQDVGA